MAYRILKMSRQPSVWKKPFWMAERYQPRLACIACNTASTIALVVFAWLLKAPTLLGRRLLDKIDGFRMYLEVAEKDDLNLRNPPEKTPELFESYLPYALALDVEQPWAEQFEEVFRRIHAEQGQDYRPAWYAGRQGSCRYGAAR